MCLERAGGGVLPPSESEGESDMSGVVIEGGWSEAPSRAARGAASADTLASYPQFSHPAFGYPDFVVSARRRRSARRVARRRTLVATMVGAVVLGGSWVIVTNEIGTHHALGQARTALAHTRQELSKTTSQRDAYQAQLRQAESQLSQAQQNLSSAQSQLSLQGNQITVLKTCLGGVLSSLSYAAANDYTDAISAINGVAGACNSASSLVAPSTPVTGSPAGSPPAATTTA